MIFNLNLFKKLYSKWVISQNEKRRSEIEKYNRNSEKKKIFKEVQPNCLENVKTLTSKFIYSQFLSDFKKTVKLGSGYDKEGQKAFCTMLHKVDLPSNVKIINYKLMLNGLPTNKKFNNKYDKKCYLCNKAVDEDLEHLFVSCEVSKKCYSFVKDNYMVNKSLNLSIDIVSYKSRVDLVDFSYLANFVYGIWITRYTVRNTADHSGALSIFKKIFNKWSISITNI